MAISKMRKESEVFNGAYTFYRMAMHKNDIGAASVYEGLLVQVMRDTYRMSVDEIVDTMREIAVA